MIKRMVIMLLAVAVVFGGIFGFQVFKAAMIKKFIAALSNPPQTISAMTAATSEWQPQIEAIGSLRAVRGADLSLEASGVVESISFNSGDDVKEGAELLKLRTADDVARLESLEAMAELNEITLDRAQRLVKTQVVSQAQIDTDAANLKNAKAQVVQQQADHRKEDPARAVRRPSRHPRRRSWAISRRRHADRDAAGARPHLCRLLTSRSRRSIRCISVTSSPSRSTPTRTKASPARYPPSIRRSTSPIATCRSARSLKNPDHKLLPGMYATVDIAVGAPTTYVTLPQTAITYNPYGDTVYVVESKGTDTQGKPLLSARQTFVTLGPTRGDQIAVLQAALIRATPWSPPGRSSCITDRW